MFTSKNGDTYQKVRHDLNGWEKSSIYWYRVSSKWAEGVSSERV